MPQPKHIVIVSGMKVFPPQTGAHIHTSAIAKGLCRLGYRVTLFSLAGRREDYGQGRTVLTQAIEPGLVEEVNLGWAAGGLQAATRRLHLPRFWQTVLTQRGWVPARLKALLQEADLVFSDFPYVQPIPGPWRDKPWYLISHNLEYRLLELAGPAEQRFVERMRRIEAQSPSRYTDIFACAPEDQAFFRANDPQRRCALPIVGAGIDPSAYQVPAGTRERVRAELGVADDDWLLVFSGSHFGPNLTALAALKTFCHEQAEFLASLRIRFLVLGSMESSAYRDGALQATGRVETIPPYLAAADAGFNPVTTGSGANIKLFEYLAARLPLVSTRFGVRGTELVADRDYLEFDAGNLRAQLTRLASERNRAEWRVRAEAVWQRHRRQADIVEVVREAVGELRDFGPLAVSTPSPVVP